MAMSTELGLLLAGGAAAAEATGIIDVTSFGASAQEEDGGGDVGSIGGIPKIELPEFAAPNFKAPQFSVDPSFNPNNPALNPNEPTFDFSGGSSGGSSGLIPGLGGGKDSKKKAENDSLLPSVQDIAPEAPSGPALGGGSRGDLGKFIGSGVGDNLLGIPAGLAKSGAKARLDVNKQVEESTGINVGPTSVSEVQKNNMSQREKDAAQIASMSEDEFNKQAKAMLSQQKNKKKSSKSGGGSSGSSTPQPPAPTDSQESKKSSQKNKKKSGGNIIEKQFDDKKGGGFADEIGSAIGGVF